MKRHGLGAGVAIVGAILAATTAGAQTTKKVVLTPYFGMYAPTTNLLVAPGGEGSARHKAGPTLGLNASWWLTDRVAFELGGAYAYSDARTVSPELSPVVTSLRETRNAYVLLGSAKAMVGLFPADSKMSLRLGFGPAIISHGGSGYKDPDGKVTGRTDVGGAISLCSKIPITDRIAVRVRAEDYLYQAKLAFRSSVDPTDDVAFDKKFQSDLLFSAGLQFAFFR